MMFGMLRTAACLALLLTFSHGFAPKAKSKARLGDLSSSIQYPFEQAPPNVASRVWNINKPGKSPFGFDVNAELWNGRVAMISFVWVFVQEMIQGKGMLAGLRDQDIPTYVSLGVFLLTLVGLVGRFSMEPFEQSAPPTKTTNPSQESPMSSYDAQYAMYTNRSTSTSRRRRPDYTAKAFESATFKTQLFNRDPQQQRWNYNDGQSPYGLKKNAEIWNGRIAMLSFAWIFLQESIQGRGILGAIDEGDPAGVGSLVMFVVGLVWFMSQMDIASKEEGDYVSRVISPEELEAARRETMKHRTQTFEDALRSMTAEKPTPTATPAYSSAPTSGSVPGSSTRAGVPAEASGKETREETSRPSAYDASEWSFELAELWNGRFAQIAFVVVFMQEVIQGKGVFKGLSEGDPINVAGFLGTGLSMLAIAMGFVFGKENSAPPSAPIKAPPKPKRKATWAAPSSTDSSPKSSTAAASPTSKMPGAESGAQPFPASPPPQQPVMEASAAPSKTESGAQPFPQAESTTQPTVKVVPPPTAQVGVPLTVQYPDRGVAQAPPPPPKDPYLDAMANRGTPGSQARSSYVPSSYSAGTSSIPGGSRRPLVGSSYLDSL